MTLDFTEAFGGIHYNNRTITLVFLSLEPWDDQMEQDSTVKNALHGRNMDIVFSDDPDYYWRGRISVGDWEFYKGAGRCTVTINAEPYKYKAAETVVSGSGEITLTNSRMSVSPRVSAAAPVTLEWDGYSVSIDAGDDQIIPQLVLEEGETVITSSGAVTFRYREGSL